MINKKLIEYLAAKSGINNKSLIEKDYVLQSFLTSLAKDKYFRTNFVFKGGTCLVKCYLGYFRFSEDLDFTYTNQDLFDGKSEKEIRRILSLETNRLIGVVSKISKELDLDFIAEKDNAKHIEFGGSNKFLTLKIWYPSSVNEKEQFFKIQVNFVELFRYRFKMLEAKPLIEKFDEKEVRFLFPEYSAVLLTKPELMAYDMKEILLEKARAILTRRGVKVRDFIDIFLITKTLKKDINVFKADIILKTRFMLRYEKYMQNLKDKTEIKKWFKPGEEEYLLLKPLEGFQPSVKKMFSFFNELSAKILASLKKKDESFSDVIRELAKKRKGVLKAY